MSGLADDLKALATLDRAGLIERWSLVFGCPAPRHCQAPLLRDTLAWHLQMQSSPEWRGTGNLNRLVRSLRLTAPALPITLGTYLLREWQGTTHRVSVVPRGFEYGGNTYRSLSAIARHITGTGWSGPRFFGLRA